MVSVGCFGLVCLGGFGCVLFVLLWVLFDCWFFGFFAGGVVCLGLGGVKVVGVVYGFGCVLLVV